MGEIKSGLTQKLSATLIPSQMQRRCALAKPLVRGASPKEKRRRTGAYLVSPAPDGRGFRHYGGVANPFAQGLRRRRAVRFIMILHKSYKCKMLSWFVVSGLPLKANILTAVAVTTLKSVYLCPSTCTKMICASIRAASSLSNSF